MKRSAFLVAMMVAGLISFGTGLNDNYWQKRHVVFAVYGSDCVNCYLGVSVTYKQLKDNYPITFVLGGVPKRVAADFVEEKIGKLKTGDTVIVNDSLFKCICPGLSSSIVITNANAIVLSMPFKSIDWPKMQLALSGQAYADTININQYAGSAQTSFIMRDENIVEIYNNIKSTLYSFNYSERKLVNTCDLRFLKDSVFAFIDACVELNTDEKLFNKTQNEAITAKTGNRVSIMQPYVTDSAIFVPVTFRSAKMMKLEGQKDSSLVLLPTQFMVRCSNTLRVTAIYSFKWNIDGSVQVFNDVHGGELNDNVFTMITESANNDSLIAMYKMGRSKVELEKVYNLKIPKSFPEKNKYGMRMGFSGFFTEVNKQPCYTFNVDPVLNFYTTGKQVALSGFDTAKFTREADPISWISTVTQSGNSIFVTGGKQGGATFLYRYNADTYKLTAQIKLFDDQPNVIAFKASKVFVFAQNDDNAYLIIKNVGDTIQ